MNASQLLAQFDRISDAPGAIPRLRQFILELAVRGKLVDQDPNDGTAADLLRGIQVHKEQLVRTGEISKSLIAVSVPSVQRFEIPSGWTWATLGDISQLVTSGSRDWARFYSTQGAIFIRMGNLSRGSYNLRLGNIQHVRPPSGSEGSRTQLAAGDILISITGEVGLLGLIPPNFGEAYINQHTCLVRRMPEMNSLYVPEMLRSTFAQRQFHGPQRGIKNSFRLSDVTSIVVPIPPLAEQGRIVARIDELMSLCDRLDAGEIEREKRRDRVAIASLRRLNEAADPVASVQLGQAAQFFLSNLPRLVTRAQHINQLRRTILNLAVRGRLVGQAENHEPAGELLSRIQLRKSQLAKTGAQRDGKLRSSVSEDELPFGVPASWCWSRIGTCSMLVEYGTSVQSHDGEDGVPILKMGDIQAGRVLLGCQKKVPAEIDDLPQLFLKRFDLLYNRTNSAELVGKTGIYIGDDDTYTFASYLIRIRFFDDLMDPEYVNVAMNAPYFRETQILPELKQQCGQANVNGTKLRNMLIPIPPLTEQHRIIMKVKQLMSLCDDLQSRLSGREDVSGRLLEAILNRSLEPDHEEELIVALG